MNDFLGSEKMGKLSVLVEAGKATAGAPLGPALGPFGINVGQVVAEINSKTKPFEGMKVPVDVLIDSATRTFKVEVGSPPTSALLKKEAKIASGAKNPKLETVGNVSMSQVVNVAKQKMAFMNSYVLKSAVKEVLGTANNMGLNVEGKKAVEIIREVEEGKFDSVLK